MDVSEFIKSDPENDIYKANQTIIVEYLQGYNNWVQRTRNNNDCVKMEWYM